MNIPFIRRVLSATPKRLNIKINTIFLHVFSPSKFQIPLYLFLIIFSYTGLQAQSKNLQAIENLNFTVFSNSYVTKDQTNSETLIIPNTLYQKRNRVFYTTEKNDTLYIAVRPHTLLELDLLKLSKSNGKGKGGVLRFRKRHYIGKFFMFLKNEDQQFKLLSPTGKLSDIRVHIDKKGGESQILFSHPYHWQRQASSPSSASTAHAILAPKATFFILASDAGSQMDKLTLHFTDLSSENTKKVVFSYQDIPSKSRAHKLSPPFNESHLKIVATDVLGNEATKQIRISLDTKPPSLSLYTKENSDSTAIKVLHQKTLFIKDSLRLLFKTSDTYSPKSKIYYATLQDENSETPMQPAALATTFTLLEESPDKTSAELLLNQSGRLMFYAEDMFGNKTSLQTFAIKKYTDALPAADLLQTR